tara:strand:+ start:171 stop:1109 length:939 start_codon:yes stop_codon:yes gene_type:complete
MLKHILHDHLDGGLRPATALELAKSINYKPLLEIEDVESFFDRSLSNSLEEYLEAFTHTIALMQNFSSIERIAFEAAEDMHKNGIDYYESRYAPFYSVNSDTTPLEVIDAINSGFKLAEDSYGIKSGLILCGMRHDAEDVVNVANLCVEVKDKIIGFDIAGPELNYPPSLFNESFKKVQDTGINITIHAGEGDGVNSINDALENGAMRIGHGVRIIEDINDEKFGTTASKILDLQVPLEICITSNIHTNMYEDYDSHPIVDLVDYGFNVYLNTDNRLMSNTSVSNELEIAKGLGIENAEKLILYSASDSFFD